MSVNRVIQDQLNRLARSGAICTIQGVSFGLSRILMYQPLLDSVKRNMSAGDLEKKRYENWLDNNQCNVFEIGEGCGDVFSANMVKSIEITGECVIIRLKGSK